MFFSLFLQAMGMAFVSLRMLKQTLINATKAGAEQLTHFFHREYAVHNKEGVNNLVTEADHAAEKAIFEVIKKDFPDHYILSEESGELDTMLYKVADIFDEEVTTLTDGLMKLIEPLLIGSVCPSVPGPDTPAAP